MILTTIKDGLSMAKYNEQIKRMNRIAKYIDYYNNDYDTYIKAAILAALPNQYQVLYKYIRKYPLTERLIQDMSIVFKQSFKYEYNGSERQIALLDDLIKKSNLKQYMSIINKFVNLVNDVGVLPRYYNGKIILDIITPDKCIIKQVDGFPTQIEQLYYFIDSNVDSINTIHPVNTMYKITNTTISKVQLNYDGSFSKQTDIQPNPYGYIPVVWFKSQLTYDSFWSSKINPIIEMHQYYVLAKSYEAMALMYQALATMITKGVPKDQKIPFGPMYWLNLPTNSTGLQDNVDAKYITPDANFQALYAYSQQLLSAAAEYAGLSVEAFKRSVQYNSGYQMAIAKTALIDYNNMQREMFINNMEQLFKVIIDTFNIYDTNFNITNIPVSINIPEPAILYNDSELQAQYEWQLTHNIITQLDLIKEKYSNITDEEAIKKYEQNKILNNNGIAVQPAGQQTQ